jgi:hypothetical protein
MKDVLRIALVTAAALGVVGLVVGVGHDTATLVSPPEAVAEQFVRKLAGGRYDVARAHLADDSPALRERIRTTSDMLRARGGAITQVAGKPGTIDGDTATATGVVTTSRAGEVVIECELVRRAGSWRIRSFALE